MRRLAIIITAALALVLASSASATTWHHCRAGDPPIDASTRTSCAFAGAIVTKYANTSMPRTWHGLVRSPVTRRSYAITCRRFGNFSTGYVACFNATIDVWLTFSADI